MELTLYQAIQKGIEAHRSGNAQEADRYYTAILKANPKHPDANHNMGVLAVGIGKAEAALPFFQTALEANSNIAQYWLSYIDALIKLDRVADVKAVFDQAKSAGIKGDSFDQLDKQINATGTKKPNTQEPSQEQLQSLLSLYTQGQYQQSLTQALQVLKQFPNSLNLYNIIGACHKGLGKLDDAVEAYNKALSLKPDYAEAYNNMGNVLQEQGKLDDAVEAYNKALSIKPDFAEAYNNMATALQNQGKPEEAIEAYIKALAIKPDYAEAYYNMGIAFQYQGKLDKALGFYTEALSIKPDYAEALNNMGNALKEQGKVEEAIEAYTEVLSSKPDYFEAYNNMGNALQEQGKLEAALEAYRKAISIKPDYADAYNNMGNVLQGQGKLEEAIEAFNKALAIKPGFADAHSNLGIIYIDLLKYKEAEVSTRKAIEIKPDLAEAHSNLGSILANLGKLQEAELSYRKAIKLNPGYVGAVFNLCGLANTIEEAQERINQCLKIDENYLEAQLHLSALKLHQGDQSLFKHTIQSFDKDHILIRSIKWVLTLPETPQLFFNKWNLYKNMVYKCNNKDAFYEYGVCQGVSFKYLIKSFKKGYGFDTFKGLPEDWNNKYKKGSFSAEGKIPEVKDGKFIAGKFEDTLPRFFSEYRPKASLINFDADLYSSTLCALNYSKSIIDKNTILIFDDFLNFHNWEQNEYKALNEFCSNNNLTYKVLAISYFSRQVAVKLIGV